MSPTVATLPGPSPDVPAAGAPARLLDMVRETASRHGHAARTIASFVFWVTRFVRFHGLCHPRELYLADLARFLEQVVREAHEPLPALEAARTALEMADAMARLRASVTQ